MPRELGLVLVILGGPDLYAVCTPNRGVVSGNPLLVGRSDIFEIAYFREETGSP